MTGTYKNADELVDVYEDLIHKFPYIIALIDPLRKEVGGFFSVFVQIIEQDQKITFRRCLNFGKNTFKHSKDSMLTLWRVVQQC